jgi:hypothetical protein
MLAAVKQIGAYMKNHRARAFRGQLSRQFPRLDEIQFRCQPNRQQRRYSDD